MQIDQLDKNLDLSSQNINYNPTYKNSSQSVTTINGDWDTCFQFILNPLEEVVLESNTTIRYNESMTSDGIGSIEIEGKHFYLKAEIEEAKKLFNNQITDNPSTYYYVYYIK